MRSLIVGLTALLSASQAWALGDSDSITWGGDNTRAGYQTNHNLDPKVVASSDFSQIFKTRLPGNFLGLAPEQIFANPLVYTGSDGVQYVYVATTQNNLYKIDAKTGAIIASRNLHVPFLQVDLESCVDINPTLGITATGVIDPDTGIWYVTSKTYADRFQDGNFSRMNSPGRLNGRYWQHAVHTEDLSEVAGWPVLLDGLVFRNNPNRMFIGGNQHSRPGALLVGDYVYTAYASHCVQYNYTGAIIGFHKKTGKIVEAFATQGGQESNEVSGGGVWMSGGGLVYDGKGSMYFSTGNGFTAQLKRTGNSLPGRNPPTSLEEAAVNAKINEDGSLTIIDFFIPWEKNDLDGADEDLGTSPFVLLPTNVFNCPNHRRIGVLTGKSGKTYWLNLDDLGGYQMGPDNKDAVIQTFLNENMVYAGAGVLPLDGGYVYIPVTKYRTHVFKFSCDSNGDALFTKVADTPVNNADIIGTSHGTTTSLDGQEGTGLLWVTDLREQGLRVYDPIPPANGDPLDLIRNFTISGVTKFSRPVFGNGRVYVSTTLGYLYGFGSPVNAALNCSSPYNFGSTSINNVSAPITITCKALTKTSVTRVSLANSTNFKISNVPSLPLLLSAGQTFDFSAVASPSSVGDVSSDIIINLDNARTGFLSSSIVTLRAKSHSIAPVLAVAPSSITFSVIAGQPGTTQSTLFWNLGDTPLTLTNVSFSSVSRNGPWLKPVTTSSGKWQVGDFTFNPTSDTIQSASSAALSVTYAPATARNSTVYVRAFSNGGSKSVDVFGYAGTQPKAVIEFQAHDGSGWVPYSSGTPFTFGKVYQAQIKNLLMRITNGGGPNAVPLSITVSKPPYGVPGIIGKSNVIDLAEGASIFAGQSQTANLYCSVPKSTVNLPGYGGSTVWVLNTGDPTQGKQTIQFSCNAASNQVGPLFPNDTARYGYVGCFKENTPGRQLAELAYIDTANNTNGKCTNTCLGLGFLFAGTEWQQECWCGNAIPIQKSDEANCNFGCAGDRSEICGGDGVSHNYTHISLFADSTRFDGNTKSAPLQLTQSIGPYDFIGCYAESGGKTLTQKSTVSNFMTVEMCAIFCNGNSYFGLEYSAECYCGSTLASTSTLTDTSQCGMSCKGSNSKYCGGPMRMQIYKLDTNPLSPLVSVTSSPVTLPVSPSQVTLPSSITSSSASRSTVPAQISTTSGKKLVDYKYVACYVDRNPRILTALAVANNSMSLDLCAAYCSGYTFFGTEYGNECYCGHALPLGSIPATDGRCNMPCANNLSQKCGGSWGLDVYQLATPAMLSNPFRISDYNAMGCYAEKPNARALKTVYASDFMTVQLCAKQASANGAVFFGLEYGRECWYDTVLKGAVEGAQSSCMMNCTGSAFQTCGGPNYLQIYGNVTVPSSSSATASVPTTSSLISTLTSPLQTTSPSASPLSCPASNGAIYSAPNGGRYVVECGIDRVDSNLGAVPVYVQDFEGCMILCDQIPGCVDVSFVKNSGGACYPKSALGKRVSDDRILGGRLLVPTSSTTTPPPMAAIATSTPRSSSTAASGRPDPPIVSGVPAVGPYNYVGCWTDNVGLGAGRALGAVDAFVHTKAMTPTTCATFCTEYAYFGVESGSECYCGPYLSNSTQVPQSDCKIACSGDDTSLCGAGNRLSVYHSNSTSKVSSDPSVPGPTIGNYTYDACYIDSGVPRLLPTGTTIGNISVEWCLARGEMFGFAYVGMESGTECWMGNALENVPGSPALDIRARESECNLSCLGAKGQLCGGTQRMNLWTRNEGV